MKQSLKKITGAALMLVPVFIIVMATLKRKFDTGSDKVRGIRNNNPLNLRRTKIAWKHEKKVITDKAFEEFETMAWGLRAGLRNMRTKINQGANTLEKLIHVWAPPSENNTSNYVKIVAKQSGYKNNEPLGFEKDFMYKIVKSMCKIESNLNLTKQLYNEAWKNI